MACVIGPNTNLFVEGVSIGLLSVLLFYKQSDQSLCSLCQLLGAHHNVIVVLVVVNKEVGEEKI